MVKKILAGVGVIVLLAVIFFGYLWWKDLTVGDFFMTPTNVLDETIYAAQQEDEELFKRGFTETSREEMDEISELNNNRPPEELGATYHWTWSTLMNRMEVEGGFEVVEEPGFFDRWTEDKAKVKIEFEGREKTYTFIKESGVWRIDLAATDPGFGKAKNCVRDDSYCN